MDNFASEKMLQAVQNAKDSAARAESEFEYEKSMLEIKSSKNIDLFDGSAINQVADIACDAGKMCDTLYASYQMLVKTLDEQCRPLLAQNPDLNVIREVYHLIKELNEESEIENNLTASFNGQSLGGVASNRYLPTIESRMIERFWENQYETAPGRAEEKAVERKKKEEAAQIAKEKREKEVAEHERKCAEWERKVKIVEQQREEAVEKKLSAMKEARINEIERLHAQAVQTSTQEQAACKKKKADAENELASLGFFKFSEKKAAKQVIEEMTAQAEQAAAYLAAANNTYEKDKADLPAWLERKKSDLQEEAKKTFPTPVRPKKLMPADEDIQNGRERMILEVLCSGDLFSAADLQKALPELSHYDEEEFEFLLAPLVSRGLVIRICDKRRSYFTLI